MLSNNTLTTQSNKLSTTCNTKELSLSSSTANSDNHNKSNIKSNNIVSATISTDFFSYSNNYKDKDKSIDLINIFEDLQKNNIDDFNILLEEIKNFYLKVKNFENIKEEHLQENLEEINSIYENSKHKELLIFSSYKAIRYSILDLCDLNLCHLYFVKIGIKLNSKHYKLIVYEFLMSISDFDFVNDFNNKYNDIQLFTTMLDLLINYANSDIDCVEPNNYNTPLHIAVIYRMYPIIILLLKFGCLKFLTNKEGLTALDLALELSIKEKNFIEDFEKNNNVSNTCLENYNLYKERKEKCIVYLKIVELLTKEKVEKSKYNVVINID